MTLVYLVATLLGYLRTEARQREIRSAFSRYMSPHYVEELAAHPEKLVLGGEMRTMTIMFCDIRGFTSRAEGMDAQTLTHFMNTFLSPMTEIITEHKGTIDKYIGDCIMAFWNAPLDDPDHAKNAVQRRQMMRRKLVELNHMWEEEATAAGKLFCPVQMGIGINTGECCVGNFGSEQHFDYSLLGDPVNLASRLEGLGKVYGIDLVIGEETAARLDEPGVDRGRSRRGQGQDPGRPCLYAAAGEDRGGRVRRPAFGAAQRLSPAGMGGGVAACSTTGAWPRRAISPRSMTSTGGESPTSRQRPPPANWDGVFTAEEK